MSKTTSSKTNKSIYRNQDSELRALFERASDPRKVLCVALDYAKKKHVALCCDGNGDILKQAFPVENSQEGVAFLVEQINATAQRRKIAKCSIFLGGEDEPSYVANFTAALRARQFLVVRVNAYEAKENRESLVASTDVLDLLSIAKTLLSRRVRSTAPSLCLPAQEGKPGEDVYYQIREISRSRRALVREKTAASNRIHALVDQLFPGFLQESKSGLAPFCQASLDLMKDRFSATEIARRKPSALASFLGRRRIQNPDELAAQLIALASSALPPVPGRLAALQRSLAAAVELLECLERNACELRNQAALLLALTPYSMLTSIRGIGFVLASGLAGEFGNPTRLGSLDSLCCYAGIVPHTEQTGGPDQPARQGHASSRCNHILKDWTLQSVQKIHLYGPPELRERISRWNANGQHGFYAGARRYLRLMRTLVFNQIPYLDPKSRSCQASDDDRADAALAAWEILTQKWRQIPGGLDLIAQETTPLGFWRRVVMQSRSVHLPLRP